MAGAMVVAGAGGGFVISPNQTLALADIPVKQGGLAGSVGQLGQRIGTAIGTAVALSLFYSTIYRESGAEPDARVYHDAYAIGMLVGRDVPGDRVRDRRRRPRRAAPAPAGARAEDAPRQRSADREDARPFVLRQVLDRGAKADARHRRGMPLDECGEPRRVEVAGGAQHPAERLLHERLRVAASELRRARRRRRPRRGGGRRTSPRARCGARARTRMPRAGRAGRGRGREVPADDVAGREVDEVPLVDAVVAAEVELVQLGAAPAVVADGPPTCP